MSITARSVCPFRLAPINRSPGHQIIVAHTKTDEAAVYGALRFIVVNACAAFDRNGETTTVCVADVRPTNESRATGSLATTE